MTNNEDLTSVDLEERVRRYKEGREIAEERINTSYDLSTKHLTGDEVIGSKDYNSVRKQVQGFVDELTSGLFDGKLTPGEKEALKGIYGLDDVDKIATSVYENNTNKFEVQQAIGGIVIPTFRGMEDRAITAGLNADQSVDFAQQISVDDLIDPEGAKIRNELTNAYITNTFPQYVKKGEKIGIQTADALKSQESQFRNIFGYN